MKTLTTLFLLLFVSFSYASDKKNEDQDNKTVISEIQKTIVISVKGIKTMEEIDIENYNKSSYLKLIVSKKQRPKTC